MRMAHATALVVLAGISLWVLVGIFFFPKPNSSGWGVDACLSCHIPAKDVPGYLQLLRRSGVSWLRERTIGQRTSENRFSSRQRVWQQEKASGFRVVAFASSFREIPVKRGNQLPEDLLEVYRAYVETARNTVGQVDAWEMVGEPETFYCSDLPDRVVAYQKAVYLGLKAGAWEEPQMKANRSDRSFRTAFDRRSALRMRSPLVLMGAFAFPPGPWARVAAENGLYDYTDAINLHHYGFAKDLGAVIAAHRQFAAKWRPEISFPIWITEAGLNNAPYNDLENHAARLAQAEYILECARQALTQGVSVFMPFVLVWKGSGFALTTSAQQTFPAWKAYAEFTKSHALGDEALPVRSQAGSETPNPVVLQWMPDDLIIPSKVSRSYLFHPSEEGWLPMTGSIYVYNLGMQPVQVRLIARTCSPLISNWDGDTPPEIIDLPPCSRKKWAISFHVNGKGYLRENLTFEAETLKESGEVGACSRLSFAVETPSEEITPDRVENLNLSSVNLDPASRSPFAYISEAPFVISDVKSPWLGINGVTVRNSAIDQTSFDVVDRNTDPLSPPMAIAALPEGLPDFKNNAFLRLKITDIHHQPASVRVDLIDDLGQRFSIVENLGRNRFLDSGSTVLLAYADFHPWVFGRCIAGKAHLEPARVREIQLRFFDAGNDKTFHVKLNAIQFDSSR